MLIKRENKKNEQSKVKKEEKVASLGEMWLLLLFASFRSSPQICFISVQWFRCQFLPGSLLFRPLKTNRITFCKKILPCLLKNAELVTKILCNLRSSFLTSTTRLKKLILKRKTRQTSEFLSPGKSLTLTLEIQWSLNMVINQACAWIVNYFSTLL